MDSSQEKQLVQSEVSEYQMSFSKPNKKERTEKVIELLKEDLKVVEFEIKQSKKMECRIALMKLSGIIDADIKQLRRKKNG